MVLLARGQFVEKAGCWIFILLEEEFVTEKIYQESHLLEKKITSRRFVQLVGEIICLRDDF